MKYQIKITQEIKDEVSKMSVDELLTKVCCPNYNVTKENEIYDTLVAFIHPSKKELEQALILNITKKLGHQVLVASDMEAGPGTAVVGSTRFPSMRSVAETGKKEYAYQMGKIAAIESREAGFSWTFAPCVDILLNHFSPIVSIRSAGESYQDVNTYAFEYFKGLEDYGMIATLKHFPGDGACQFDQHVTTATNPLSKEEWDNSYRKVYEKFINAGAKTIMPGHIALPSYDEKDLDTGCYPPATLSYNLLTKLLKQDLGFEGIIISDATEMGGFCGYLNYYEACARFLMSGGDLLLFTHPNKEYLTLMKELISSGKLSIDVLRTRVMRIVAFVKEYETSKKILPAFDKKIHEEIAKNVVEYSVKVFYNKKKILPITKKNPKVAYVVIASNIQKEIITSLEEGLKKKAIVDTFIDPGCNKIKEIAKSGEYDYIIANVTTFQWYGTNMITLSGTIARNMMNGWMRYQTPCIFVDFGNPYLHEEYPAMLDSLIYTYGYADETINAVINKIFEE